MAPERNASARPQPSGPACFSDTDYEQRLQAVLALRQGGLTFPQIGRILGVSKQRAYQLWDEARRCRSAQRRMRTVEHSLRTPGF